MGNLRKLSLIRKPKDAQDDTWLEKATEAMD